MNSLSLKPLTAFVFKLLLFLPPALALWWFAGRDAALLVLAPAMRWLAKWLMADTILTITAQEAGWLVKTSLSPLDNPLLLVALLVYPARVTVSFPLLWGLVLATPEATRLKQLALGTLLLVPINLLMIGLLIQFELALYINHQPLLGLKPPAVYLLALPYPDYLYHLFGVGRQLALLVLPTLAPVLVWGLFNRCFIGRLQSAAEFGQPGNSQHAQRSPTAKASAMVCRALGTAVCLIGLIGCDPQAKHYHDALERLGKRDFPAAAEGFARLAEKGHAAAQFRLGLLYLYGKGVAKNPQHAIGWLSKAAEQNEVGAQFYLANLHLKGIGVPQDFAVAFQGFQRLAIRGYVPAQYLLGVMYEKGVGIARNDAEAARWTLVAAEQGHREAIARLAEAYREGRLGLPKDPDRVSYWENRARNRGIFD